MRLFDLHCDTLYKAVTMHKSLNCNDFNISVSKGRFLDKWIQCYAIWLPDDLSDSEAISLFNKAVITIKEQCSKLGIHLCKSLSEIPLEADIDRYAVFTLENGRILTDESKSVQMIRDSNIKIVTLTWNGDNCLGTGALTDKDYGLTQHGKKVLKELEKANIIVDVSHSSERTFWDVIDNSSVPITATHSDSKLITPHPRNITDNQFLTIKEKGGVVGVNFYRGFLNADESKATVYDIIKHTEHFLSLGGENTVALGSDFDGCELPGDIKGIESFEYIYECFLRENYSEALLDKLFFKNAFNFCQNFDNSK